MICLWGSRNVKQGGFLVYMVWNEKEFRQENKAGCQIYETKILNLMYNE
jgi:hypothetical protein